MHPRWIVTILLVILLTTCSTDAQKRRKGEKKKDSEATTVASKSEAKPEGGGKQRSGRHTTTTPTTTQATTTATFVEEDVDEEIQIVNQPRSVGNLCPPELKPQEGKVLPCTCRDELDDNALMVECANLTNAQQMHKIFNVNMQFLKCVFMKLISIVI